MPVIAMAPTTPMATPAIFLTFLLDLHHDLLHRALEWSIPFLRKAP